MSEIVKKDQQSIAVNQPTNLLEAIGRMSTDPNVDVEKFERMMNMYERMESRKAEQEFNAALVSAQQEMRAVGVDATNPQTRSKYATYAKLDSKLRPIYTNHGFSLSFDTDVSPIEGHVRVMCYVANRSGFSRTYHVDMPADGKGAKGGDVMTKTHATGAAMSYGMRYLLKMIFNVAVGEEDVDGNETLPRISAQQVADLEALIDEVNADRAGFEKWMRGTLKCNSVEELNENGFKTAVAMLERKRRNS